MLGTKLRMQSPERVLPTSGYALYTWGQNANYATGFDIWEGSTSELTQIEPEVPTDWTSFSMGYRHGLAIRNGCLYSWGGNSSGRTGLGLTSGNAVLPMQVGVGTEYESGWTDVVAGAECSLGIRDGKLYAWGSNLRGKTGLGLTSGNTPIPTQVGIGTDYEVGWTAIHTSNEHALGIRDNKLYVWGTNESYRTGLDTDQGTTSVPTQVGIGQDIETGWTSISAVYQMSAGVCNGDLYTWGRSSNGETGVGVSITSITVPRQLISVAGADPDMPGMWEQVSTGMNYCLGIRDGQLFAWGNNQQGQLGRGNTTRITRPVLIDEATTWSAVSAGYGRSLAINNGLLYQAGTYGFRDSGIQQSLLFEPIGDYSDWKAISQHSGYYWNSYSDYDWVQMIAR